MCVPLTAQQHLVHVSADTATYNPAAPTEPYVVPAYRGLSSTITLVNPH